MREIKYDRLSEYLCSLGPVLLLVVSLNHSFAQGFGKNPIHSPSQEFEVLTTPHLKLHSLTSNGKASRALLHQGEAWVHLFQYLFQDSLSRKRDIVLYPHYPEYQQHAFPAGLIAEKGRRRFERNKRLGLSTFMYTHRQTDQLLARDLAQAFIFHQLQKKDSLPLKSFQYLPEGFDEGLISFLSEGVQHTAAASWVRDLYLSGNVPEISTLEESILGGYPYAHAFWAFVVGNFGESQVAPFLEACGRYGFRQAVKGLWGIGQDSLFQLWHEQIQVAYDSLKQTHTWNRPLGKPLATPLSAGAVNTAPALSPSGKYLAFLTERDIVSTQLYILHTETGRVLMKLPKENASPHETYRFQESPGTWSPDDKRFAVPIISNGINKLLIVDVEGKQKLEVLEVPGIKAFTHPEWSPKGKRIIFSGMVEGNSDLFCYDLGTQELLRLTQDSYSDIHPTWSPDGTRILFVSDRLGDRSNLAHAPLSLYQYYLNSHKLELIPIFLGANNTNPIFGSSPSELFFLSDREGLRNVYKYDFEQHQVFQYTQFFTGVSGLSPFSKSISMGKERDELVYTLFHKGEFGIYKTPLKQIAPIAVATDSHIASSGLLPGHSSKFLPSIGVTDRKTPISTGAYMPQFHLAYVGNVSSGLNLGGNFNSGRGEGIRVLFSDVMQNNLLLGTISIKGELFDLGGQFAYLNQKHNVHWGLGFSHTPFRVSEGTMRQDSLVLGEEKWAVNHLNRTDLRQFEDELSLFIHYPLSRFHRLEGGISRVWYHSRIDEVDTYFDVYGNFLKQERAQKEALEKVGLFRTYLAYVGDKTTFGGTSPLHGWRYRLQAATALGNIQVHTLSADLRLYHFFRPISIGLRTSFKGRFGRHAEYPAFAPLFIGFPGNVHGFFGNALDQQLRKGVSLDQLSGSRTWVGNMEVRLPFSGMKDLAFLPSKFLFSDLVWFFDGGIAWNQQNTFSLGYAPTPQEKRIPVFSTGLALRTHLFGILGVEPYWAFPLINGKIRNGVFGLNFSPGW